MTNRTLRFAVWIIVALTVLLGGACTTPDTVAYSHFEQIPTSGWDPVDVIIFEPWPMDSTEAAGSSYQMDMVLRYSARKALSQLPVALTIENEAGILRKDTMVLHTDSHPNGDTGRVMYGVREVTVPLERNLQLSEGYRISLSPLSPPETTEGLLNIGIILSRP